MNSAAEKSVVTASSQPNRSGHKRQDVQSREGNNGPGFTTFVSGA